MTTWAKTAAQSTTWTESPGPGADVEYTVITPSWFDIYHIDWFRSPWFVNAWFGGYVQVRSWTELSSASLPSWTDLASASTSWATLS